MAELVADGLDAFLADYGALPWSPGGDVDCCLALAAWLIWRGYPDPACALRGTYSDEAGFRRLIIHAGGIVSLISPCIPVTGIATTSPIRGDIGVIGSRSNIHRQFGAIHDGRGWLVRQKQGFGRMSAKTLAAWTFPTK